MTKEERAKLAAELDILKELDRDIHTAMPPGGNAYLERVQVRLGDLIRLRTKELGQ